MISLPTFDQFEGLVIFPDDEDISHYYFLPRNPQLKKGPDGTPMFTFYRYQYPIDRAGPEKGGGYLTFTTMMNEEQSFLDEVKKHIEQLVRAAHPTRTDITVTLSPVDFTDGSVQLIMMKDNQFVHAIDLGKPSLFADNTASVAIELGEYGASLFYDALKKGASVGAIEYDLSFPVRLPGIQITASISSKEVHDVVIGYAQEKVTNSDTWGNTETHTVAHRTSISESMHSLGLIHLDIKKGDVNLSNDDVASLQAFAFKAMDDWINAHFLKGGSFATDEDKKSQWMRFIGEDLQDNFYLDVTYRDVIRRSYSPSTQITPAFLGVPIDKAVIDIDLGTAPWYYNNLKVTIDTNLDFDKYGDIVHSVVGHLSYDQKTSDGTRITNRESFRFAKDNAAPQTFMQRMAAVGKDIYHVDIEVNYTSGPVLQTVIKSFDTMTRNLTLDVPNPGVMEINFAAIPGAFDQQLSAVEVEVQYADVRRNVPDTTETIILTKEKPEFAYKRVIYAPWDQPYHYRATYILKDSDGNIQRSSSDWIQESSDTHYVKIATPFDQYFSLNVIPSVLWGKVQQLVVDLAYDSGDYHEQQNYSFSQSAHNIQAWKFPLRDPSQRSYRFKQTMLMQSSSVVEGQWQTRDQDGTLVVGNARYGVITVHVDPGDVDLGNTVKRVQVSLQYMDPSDSQVLVFRNATPQDWSFARDPSQDHYAYSLEYIMSDGTRHKVPVQQESFGGQGDNYLFVPAAPAASTPVPAGTSGTPVTPPTS